ELLREVDARVAEIAAWEGASDAELARYGRRALVIMMTRCGFLLTLEGGTAVRAAPDKVGAFFEKAAASLVQLDPADASERRPALDASQVHERDPLAHAIETWSRAD